MNRGREGEREQRDTDRDIERQRDTVTESKRQGTRERERERKRKRERKRQTYSQTETDREMFEGLKNLAQLSGTPGAATSDCQIEACVSNDLHAYSAAKGGEEEPFLSKFTASDAPAASQVTNACVCVYVCVSNAVVKYEASSVIWRL